DAVEGITEQDTKIAGLALKQGRACLLLVNKWDLRQGDDAARRQYELDLRRRLPFLPWAPVLFGSALKPDSVSEVFPLVDQVVTAFTRRIPTGLLNKFLQEVIAENPLPVRKGKPGKAVKSVYVTQVATQPPVFALFVGHPEDVGQDTFLNAYRGLKNFRGDPQIPTWLYTIASRASIRMRRKRKGGPERELSLDEFIPTSEGEFRLQIPTEGLTPQEALENKEIRRALHQAIVKLPKKYRLVLVLRDMEGLTAREVGSIMGLNERAVKSRLHRARLFVRRELSARGIAGHPHLARTTGST